MWGKKWRGKEMKNQSWYPWAELWNHSVLWSSVTKNQELLKKIVYQHEMTSSGTRLQFTVIAVNMETEGQVSMSAVLKHWRVFIKWDRVMSVPTVAWPLFTAALLGFASDYGLQGNCSPFLPPFLRCAAADAWSHPGLFGLWQTEPYES